MTYKNYLFAIIFVIPLLTHAAEENLPAKCAEILTAPTITLAYEGEYYQAKFVSSIKSTRFSTLQVDGQGTEVFFAFDIISKNLEPNGAKPPIWELTEEGRLYIHHVADETISKMSLQFEGYGYKTQFVASRRVANYVGTFTAVDGSKKQIYVKIHERNLEPDGLKESRWERTGRASILTNP